MKRTNLPFLRQLSTSQKKVDPVQEALMKENVIRVDRSDNALGPMTKRDSHLLDASGKSALHRAFSLFIFNHKNELLLQQRSDVKVCTSLFGIRIHLYRVPKLGNCYINKVFPI